jgi:hypothetical protein
MKNLSVSKKKSQIKPEVDTQKIHLLLLEQARKNYLEILENGKVQYGLSDREMNFILDGKPDEPVMDLMFDSGFWWRGTYGFFLTEEGLLELGISNI